MLQDLANNIRVFNRRDDPNATTALFTLLYINGKDSLEPLRPGPRIGLRFRVLLFYYRLLRNNVFTQFAIGREHPMKTREVHAWHIAYHPIRWLFLGFPQRYKYSSAIHDLHHQEGKNNLSAILPIGIFSS